MAEPHGFIRTRPEGYSNRTSNEFEQRELAQGDKQLGSKFDLGPRWSSEEIHLFFDGMADQIYSRISASH